MKKLILYVGLMLSIVSCRKDQTVQQNDGENDRGTEVVLQKRDPLLSTVWSKKIELRRASAARSFMSLENYIGRGYVVGNSILGDGSNSTFHVIDLNKLRTKFSSAIASERLAKSDIFTLAYSNFERYEANTSITQKVKSGFSLNLGLFKLGRKRTQTEVFKTTNLREDLSVYGEIGIEVQHGKHTLNTNSTVTNVIASECLDDLFILTLYNSPISEILEDYGPLVLTGYYTGGRASAFYKGELNEVASTETKESDMQKELNASFVWNKTDTARASLEFGLNKGTGSSLTTKVKKLYYSVQTIGGLNNVATVASDITQFSMDLSPWLSSLSNDDTHVMTGIQDGGLTGLPEFVLETNFKRRIQDTHLGYINGTELLEPFIEIVKVLARTTSSGEKLYDVCPVLNTRQGDKIILSQGNVSQLTDAELRANNDPATFVAKCNTILADKSRFYKCEIRANSNVKILPILRIPLSIELKALNESGMFKYRNDKSNMWYVYDPVTRYAFSYYDDDYIPEAYGVNNWFASIPEKSISMTTLYQRYTIIGL